MRETLVKSEKFKDSPIGRIPKDWDAVSIDEIAVHVGSGITPRGGSNVYKKEGILFIRSQNVTFNGLQLDDVAYIDNRTHEGMKRSEIFPHDVLLNITGASIGRCCRVPAGLGAANVNQHVCAIRLPKPNREDAIFLSSVLASYIGQSQIDRLNAGGNREGLNYEQLRAFVIPFPPSDERAGIAKILETVDKEIAHTSSLIAKLKQMKVGLLHDLLTRGLDENGELRDASAHPEKFKPSPLGRIPKDWNVLTIGEACLLVKDGAHLLPKRVENGPLLLSVQNIINSRLQWSNSDTRISWDFYKSMHRNWEIQVGDVLLTIIGTIGRTAIVPPMPPFTLQRNVAVLRGKTSILDNLFLHHYLASEFFQKIVVVRGNQTAQPAIFLSDINLLKIPLPSLKEQKKIATVVEEYNTRIRTEEAYRDKLKLQKQGLMHDLLTGKVRVKDV